MNAATFKQLLTTAALAGLLAGLLLTAVQQLQVAPLILDAERYEHAAGNHAPHPSDEHSHADWQPRAGMERSLYTGGANIVMAVGFALLLGAVTILRGTPLDWRTGLLWGAAGYAVFFIAPALGLPPEVPGAQTAGLVPRQLWWITAAACTAGGLALAVFGRGWGVRVLAAPLLLAPHLIGAPQVEVHGSTAPAELAQAFVAASAVANAVFWLVLGGLFGFFQRRFAG